MNINPVAGAFDMVEVSIRRAGKMRGQAGLGTLSFWTLWAGACQLLFALKWQVFRRRKPWRFGYQQMERLSESWEIRRKVLND